MNNTPGHPEPYEFNTKSVKVINLLPNTVSLIQSIDQGVIRAFKAHYTQYSMERIVRAMEENPHSENIMKVCKDYTTEAEDAIVVIEKAMKATRPEIMNSCWR